MWEFTVRLEQHIAPRPAEHDPLAVGRIPGEVVAHAVVRSPFKRLGDTPSSTIERHPVKIEQKGASLFEKLGTVFRTQQDLPSVLLGFQGISLTTGKDNVLPIRTPGSGCFARRPDRRRRATRVNEPVRRS